MGNEAVDQLTKFDRAMRDFSGASTGKSRGIDGMLITKWDTVDDKVCLYPRAGRVPVFNPSPCCAGRRMLICVVCHVLGRCCAFDDLRHGTAHYLCGLWAGACVSAYGEDKTERFVGVQTYTDLRQLKVSNVVQAILSD